MTLACWGLMSIPFQSQPKIESRWSVLWKRRDLMWSWLRKRESERDVLISSEVSFCNNSKPDDEWAEKEEMRVKKAMENFFNYIKFAFFAYKNFLRFPFRDFQLLSLLYAPTKKPSNGDLLRSMMINFLAIFHCNKCLQGNFCNFLMRSGRRKRFEEDNYEFPMGFIANKSFYEAR